MQERRAERDAFAERLFRSALGYFDLLSIRLGQRLGLYEVFAEGSVTSQELSARAGIAERYAREWLEQQVTAGILRADVQREDHTFSLPPGHAEVLLDGDSLSYMGASVWQLLTIPNAFENVVEAFRTGGGVSHEAYGRDNVQGQGLGNRPVFLTTLPIDRQRGEEDGPVAEALPLDVVPTVRLVGHAASSTECLDHVLERVGDGEQLPDRGAHVGKGIAVQQDLGVARREREGVVLSLDVGTQDAGGHLLLQPLPRVALRDPCPRGQFLRGHRALREDLVQTEALAEADRQQVEIAERGTKEPLREGIPLGSTLLHGGREPIGCAPKRPSPQFSAGTVISRRRHADQMKFLVVADDHPLLDLADPRH